MLNVIQAGQCGEAGGRLWCDPNRLSPRIGAETVMHDHGRDALLAAGFCPVVTQFGCESVTLKVCIDVGDDHALGQRQGLGVDLCAADDPHFGVVLQGRQRIFQRCKVQGCVDRLLVCLSLWLGHTRALPVRVAGQHHVHPAWQRPETRWQ